MNFESLANETLLDLFDYFDGTDLLHTFYELNFRFNSLLYKQFRSFRLKFNSILKRQFDIICQQHLSFIADRVISLSLSNGDDTPHQIDLFFSHMSSINQFTHLRSLSISNLHTYTTIMKIIDECHPLSYLTDLKFESCFLGDNEAHYQSIIDNIWSLPKVIVCKIDITTTKGWNFYTPIAISSSLESLSFAHYKIKLNQINYLFENIPRLKHLSIIVEDSDSDYFSRLLPTLTSLDIRVIGMFDISKIIRLLQNMPNLHRLHINVLDRIINSYQWEQVISNYLPKLKLFQFRMKSDFGFHADIPKRMDELIDPFRSSFWIDEHHWFVRCFTEETKIHLCTMFNTFQSYRIRLPHLFISTHSDDDLQNFYDDMTQIGLQKFAHEVFPLNIHFANIKDLTITSRIDGQVWSFVSNLNKLQSLTVLANLCTCESDLQAVFVDLI